MLGAALSARDFIWLLGSLCQLNRLPFDQALILQRFPAPHTGRQFLEAAQSLGFKTGEAALPPQGLKGVRLPCVAFLKPLSSAETGDALRPAILIKTDAERLLYFVAGSQTPANTPIAQFSGQFEPNLILVRHESASQGPETGDGAAAAARFGFRWFGSELLRHKRIWRDVLFASLFIQLIGLSTPVFTQVIIDKVIVHQTTSTLIAIAVGLVMFMLFNTGMSWLRQAD